MSITAKMIADLRAQTGAGIMDCKKALAETNGDMPLAVEYLQKKSLAAVGKRADKVAAEGAVGSYIHNGRVGALVEINCETDFVGRGEDFQKLLKSVANHIAVKAPSHLDQGDSPEATGETSLLQQRFFEDGEKTVADVVTEVAAVIKENIKVRRFVCFDAGAPNGAVGSYIHDGRIGVLVEVGCETEGAASGAEVQQLIKDIAMHVAAMNPSYLDPSEISDEATAKQREIMAARNEGKPAAMMEKIVDGQIRKWHSDVCLMQQEFFKEDKKSVADIISAVAKGVGEKLTVRRFARFELGAGIEREATDFAAEVAATAGV